MNVLIINPDKTEDLELVKSLLLRMNIPFTGVSSEEEEDQVLASLIEEAKDDLLDEQENEDFLRELGVK